MANEYRSAGLERADILDELRGLRAREPVQHRWNSLNILIRKIERGEHVRAVPEKSGPRDGDLSTEPLTREDLIRLFPSGSKASRKDYGRMVPNWDLYRLIKTIDAQATYIGQSMHPESCGCKPDFVDKECPVVKARELAEGG